MIDLELAQDNEFVLICSKIRVHRRFEIEMIALLAKDNESINPLEGRRP
jgi:hypothetical protein